MKQIAVIRVRGTTGIQRDTSDTMDMLRLYKRNFCTVVPDNESYMGMIHKAKDFVTWGEIDTETLKELVDKRGEEYNTSSEGKTKEKDYITLNGKKVKKFFRLNPPLKGYGRKGIKRTFKDGGALGPRGDKINDLVKRML